MIGLEDAAPGCAAVGRLEDPAVVFGGVGVALCGDPDDVRVIGVNTDLADLADVIETDMRPALSGVRRLVYAVTLGRHRVPERRLAHADNDNVRVRRRDGDGANSGAAEVLVRYRLPGRTGVHRLPHAAGRAHVVHVRILAHADGHHRAAAAVRPDHAGFEAVEECPLLSGRRLGHCGESYDQAEQYGAPSHRCVVAHRADRGENHATINNCLCYSNR